MPRVRVKRQLSILRRISDWFTQIDEQRARRRDRMFWARREAEEMRTQYGGAAERVCNERLARTDLSSRRRRFTEEVRRQLAKS